MDNAADLATAIATSRQDDRTVDVVVADPDAARIDLELDHEDVDYTDMDAEGYVDVWGDGWRLHLRAPTIEVRGPSCEGEHGLREVDVLVDGDEVTACVVYDDANGAWTTPGDSIDAWLSGHHEHASITREAVLAYMAEEEVYTYTIFDAHPGASGQCSWPDHESIEIRAESDERALEAVRKVLAEECEGLADEDDYDVGDKIYALVWRGEDGICLDTLEHTIEEGWASEIDDA